MIICDSTLWILIQIKTPICNSVKWKWMRGVCPVLLWQIEKTWKETKSSLIRMHWLSRRTRWETRYRTVLRCVVLNQRSDEWESEITCRSTRSSYFHGTNKHSKTKTLKTFTIYQSINYLPSFLCISHTVHSHLWHRFLYKAISSYLGLNGILAIGLDLGLNRKRWHICGGLLSQSCLILLRADL